MNSGYERSPDAPEGVETFEQADEAFDESDRVDPGFSEAVEADLSNDPTNEFNGLGLEEAGAVLDDPEVMAILRGGGDHPDGIRGPPSPSGVASHDEQVGPRCLGMLRRRRKPWVMTSMWGVNADATEVPGR
ncbi:MAG: hypothetical protein ACR2KC_01380 [Acidimicrobiales bacterium]